MWRPIRFLHIVLFRAILQEVKGFVHYYCVCVLLGDADVWAREGTMLWGASLHGAVP